jgi:uncharacterized protein (DUF927 family)
MVLSSGEITLADKMAEAGSRIAAGQAVRLLDVAADGRAFGAFDDLHDAADGAAFADRLRGATATQYGTAGVAFVTKFLENREDATKSARAVMENFSVLAARQFDLTGEGQTARAIARLGIIAAAGELATSWGLTGWAPGAATAAAIDVLSGWLEARGGGGPAEARDAVDRVRAFLVAHGDSRFEDVNGETIQRVVNNRAGWRDKETFYIGTDAWKEIHKGADPTRAAGHLQAAGYLTKGDGRNWAARAPHAIVGRPRVYTVSGEILGAGDD